MVSYEFRFLGTKIFKSMAMEATLAKFAETLLIDRLQHRKDDVLSIRVVGQPNWLKFKLTCYLEAA